MRPRLSEQGEELREANRLRYKAASEAFGAIKDVKILGKEESFSELYGAGARRFASTQAANQILSQLPALALQAVAIGFAVTLVIIMLAVQGTLVQVLPLIALYAFAVQRLIPNIQGVFSGVTQVRYYGQAVDALYADMTGTVSSSVNSDNDSLSTPKARPFVNDIELQNLSFSYPTSSAPVLKEINLRILKNTTVGFVGTTGCGKTTLVDVIMGLLVPTSGLLLADGLPVDGYASAQEIGLWQRNFGYVPQQIYLSDDTIASNIAFGIPEDLRDGEAVDHAARVANLREFVINELPKGYDTMVGERGVRLSGGQRQRVGIARALYHDPDIVVMDEATSALDSVTEEAVMDAIHNLAHTKTIIIIAHRITTVKECDVICMLEKGRIVASGRYDELLRDNSRFRAMAKVSPK
ncbi:MAG TPA: ATP-binding cassette domain-containing protein [Anaerolineales bacterium]|nr:ATP-binding cassette domain-containing protein [Anaerolineales bacterium]